jgi:hypothetical protein
MSTCSCGVDFDYLSPRWAVAAGSRDEAIRIARAYERGTQRPSQMAYHPDDLDAEIRARYPVWAVRFWIPLGKGLNSPLQVREAGRWTP